MSFYLLMAKSGHTTGSAPSDILADVFFEDPSTKQSGFVPIICKKINEKGAVLYYSTNVG